jgi:hypothetical protein
MSHKRPAPLNPSTHAIHPQRVHFSVGHSPPWHVSMTPTLDDALQTGLSPLDLDDEEIPGQDGVLSGGDPDVDPLDMEYSGDEAAGGSNSSPDNNDVDAIGRLYGITQADAHGLVLGDDLIAPRDRARWENNPASKDK